MTVPSQLPLARAPGRPAAEADAHDDGRVTLRTLILIRWIAIIGQLATVLAVQFWLKHDLPIGPALAAIGASVLLNLVAMAQRGGRMRLSDRDVALYLGYDTLELTLLIYLTGGLANPFSALLLAPLTVAASVLTRSNVVGVTGLTLFCFSVLAVWHFPLPWPVRELELPWLYSIGIWISLFISAVFIAVYVFRVAEEARRIAEALAASQMALAREQRLSALGALAAAAAHELGSPLSTIALVASELARDIPPGSEHGDDIALLQSQTERCRLILAELARRPETDGGDPYERLPLRTLIETAAAPHHTGAVELEIVADAAPDSDEPVVRRSPEIVHSLGNLIQNALQFARRRVTVTVSWNAAVVVVTVADDGPGFPAHLLSRIGEPYISTRADRGAHMGLGIFIAKTLVERTGATVEFDNKRSGGAKVAVCWERGKLETQRLETETV